MWPYPWTHVGTPSHLGHMDRVAATMPSQAHAGAAQEAPDIGQWEGQDVPLVRPSSCNVKRGIPSSRRYLPTYLVCSPMVGEAHCPSLPPDINMRSVVPRTRPRAGLSTRGIGSVRCVHLHTTTSTAGHLDTPAYVNRFPPIGSHSWGPLLATPSVF